MSMSARFTAAVLAAIALGSAAGRAGTGDVTLSQLSLDGGFGAGGTVTRIGRGANRIDVITNVAFDSQGRIVVAGLLFRTGSTTDDFYRSSRPAVARLLDPGVPRGQGRAHGRGLRTPWAR